MSNEEDLKFRVNEIRKQLEEHPDQAIEITHEEAKYMGAFEDDSMSMEDALASHDFDKQSKKTTHSKVIDTAETAAKGEFLDPPAFVCLGIKE